MAGRMGAPGTGGLGDSVILEEEIDENYEPTPEEILEYARWLGMDVEREKDLIWLAREGLKAPLPDHWKPCKSPEGEIYYFNFSSGESVWDHPCDEYYKKLYAEEKAKWETRNVEKELAGRRQKRNSESGNREDTASAANPSAGLQPLKSLQPLGRIAARALEPLRSSTDSPLSVASTSSD
eukprot:7406181-Pyramimonas_sp.AAC.1